MELSERKELAERVGLEIVSVLTQRGILDPESALMEVMPIAEVIAPHLAAHSPAPAAPQITDAITLLERFEGVMDTEAEDASLLSDVRDFIHAVKKWRNYDPAAPSPARPSPFTDAAEIEAAAPQARYETPISQFTKAPCCGGEPRAIYYNPDNRAVQCHQCGHVYEPKPPCINGIAANFLTTGEAPTWCFEAALGVLGFIADGKTDPEILAALINKHAAAQAGEDAAKCDGCAQPFATPSHYCFVCYQSAREAGYFAATTTPPDAEPLDAEENANG